MNIEEEKAKIDKMSQTEMCRLRRFAPSSHPYFGGLEDRELSNYFEMKFKEKGGFTAEISKAIGWDG